MTQPNEHPDGKGDRSKQTPERADPNDQIEKDRTLKRHTGDGQQSMETEQQPPGREGRP